MLFPSRISTDPIVGAALSPFTFNSLPGPSTYLEMKSCQRFSLRGPGTASYCMRWGGQTPLLSWAYKRYAPPSCCRAAKHFVRSAALRAPFSAGRSSEMSTAIMPMTTSNSTNVKALLRFMTISEVLTTCVRRPLKRRLFRMLGQEVNRGQDVVISTIYHVILRSVSFFLRSDTKMDYRDLGRAGVKVSPICLGNMNFGGSSDETTSRAIMDHAVERGINFFDTANVYQKSVSE